MSIKEIAADCGYSNDNYFIKAFRNKEGRTPGAFRKNSLQAEANPERKSNS
jgi:AraC-like DNA-binding protein